MKNNGLWYFLFFNTSIFLFSCGGPVNNTPPTSISVNIEDVKEENATYYDLYPVNIIAINEVKLRSEVNGFITGIFFKEGQTVYYKKFNLDPKQLLFLHYLFCSCFYFLQHFMKVGLFHSL